MLHLNTMRYGCYLAPVLLLLLFIISACMDEQSNENNRLREEIISVHDEAMDKIGYMYELEITLQAIPVADPATKQARDEAVAKLQLANKKMFDWMHQYQTLAVSQDIAEDNRYRKQQLLLIQDVQLVTDESIKKSEKLLNSDR
ncbi:MAG: hypothetical protein V2I35_12685 [Desulfocapsaceae bacterium]|jgi:hypothetical protein|nr:hypothetical protein [Desulfocapsaceae bacterium]